MSRGRWYLATIFFAVLFWHAYGPSWKMILALVGCLMIWIRTVLDEKRRGV